ncbi:MAG: hypothetical protein ABR928_08745 [Terracidiphilus sp.]|jgi:hypothetical protein
MMEDGIESIGVPRVPRIWGPGKLIGPLVILLAAFVVIVPEILRGASCGHDFDVHLVSWFDCLNAWRHGIFYPHWAPSPNYGAGEPRFVYYPPFTWIIGAALGAVLPWAAVPVALTFLIFAATGFVTRALARLALSEAQSTLAGCVAIFSGYALFTSYERSAFPEFAGGFWLPLLMLFALRPSHVPKSEGSPPHRPGAPSSWGRFARGGPGRSAFGGSTIPLAIALAGAWLSNVPLGVMAAYLLASLALLAAIANKSWAPILRATVGGALGLGLAAFYWLPAALERNWVDVRQATQDPGYNFEYNWLFAHHADPTFALHDAINHQASWIAVTMIAIAIVAFPVAWRRGTLPSPTSSLRWWIPLAAIPVWVALLCVPLSRPVWHALPEMPFLQYPWRWLEAVEAPMAIFLVAAIWPAARRARIAVCAACALGFIAALVYADRNYFQACYPEDAVPAMLASYRAGAGFDGMFEYSPPNSDITAIARGLPDACLVADPDAELGQLDPDDSSANPIWTLDQKSCVATFATDRFDPEHLRLNAMVPQSGWLVLRLLAFPAWRAELNGQALASDRANALHTRPDGMIAVRVERGPIHLDISWKTTSDVILGRWVSAIALVLAVLPAWFERRLVRD